MHVHRKKMLGHLHAHRVYRFSNSVPFWKQIVHSLLELLEKLAHRGGLASHTRHVQASLGVAALEEGHRETGHRDVLPHRDSVEQRWQTTGRPPGEGFTSKYEPFALRRGPGRHAVLHRRLDRHPAPRLQGRPPWPRADNGAGHEHLEARYVGHGGHGQQADVGVGVAEVADAARLSAGSTVAVQVAKGAEVTVRERVIQAKMRRWPQVAGEERCGSRSVPHRDGIQQRCRHAVEFVEERVKGTLQLWHPATHGGVWRASDPSASIGISEGDEWRRGVVDPAHMEVSVAQVCPLRLEARHLCG